MKQSKMKQLRDFIKSHEMRYFVEQSDYSGKTHIKKAFKVEVNDAEYWMHFAYGDHPIIKDERCMLKTMEEAKAKAQELRDEYKREKQETAEKFKERMKYVVNFLNKFSWFGYQNWDTQEIKPEGQPLAKAITRLYENMPRREKDDEQTYIALLENYITTGTIYTQAMSFRKEHVVSVKYGDNETVKIELVNGTTIIPWSESVTKLIKTIFGDRLDTWSYDNIERPKNKYDIMEEPEK